MPENESASSKLPGQRGARKIHNSHKYTGGRFVQQWRNAVLAPAAGLTSTQKLVLTVLGQFANADGGSCFPSIETIAEGAALCTKATKLALNAALALGWFDRTERPAGKGRAWREYAYEYRLKIPGADDVDSSASAKAEESNSSRSSEAEERAVEEGQERGEERGTPYLEDLDFAVDPIREQEKHTHQRVSDFLNDSVEQICSLYNSILADVFPLPKVRKADKRHEKYLKRSADLVNELRLDLRLETPVDFFRVYFETCAENIWLRGEAEYKNDFCPVNFEYLTRPYVIESVHGDATRGHGHEQVNHPERKQTDAEIVAGLMLIAK